MKLWTIKTNECVATLDQHTEKIWSLASSADGEVLVSGGADSVVCLWKVGGCGCDSCVPVYNINMVGGGI